VRLGRRRGSRKGEGGGKRWEGESGLVGDGGGGLAQGSGRVAQRMLGTDNHPLEKTTTVLSASALSRRMKDEGMKDERTKNPLVLRYPSSFILILPPKAPLRHRPLDGLSTDSSDRAKTRTKHRGSDPLGRTLGTVEGAAISPRRRLPSEMSFGKGENALYLHSGSRAEAQGDCGGSVLPGQPVEW